MLAVIEKPTAVRLISMGPEVSEELLVYMSLQNNMPTSNTSFYIIAKKYIYHRHKLLKNS